MPGTLFLVATPIGNLEDITIRALRILREVSVILAEDTRRTAGLLAHYDIHTPTLSHHAHNERTATPAIVDRLLAGENVALVSDAGTPVLSDPGAPLVHACRQAGCRVEVLPGASALITALVATGWPIDSFVFLGFPPRPVGQKRSWVQALSGEPRTVVFFEAPHRIVDTLETLCHLLPERQLAVARELTKIHEQILVGTPAEVLGGLVEHRGEFTVVVAPAPDDLISEVPDISDTELWREFCLLTSDSGTDRRTAISTLGRRYGRPGRVIYAALERAKAGER